MVGEKDGFDRVLEGSVHMSQDEGTDVKWRLKRTLVYDYDSYSYAVVESLEVVGVMAKGHLILMLYYEKVSLSPN